MRPVTGRRLAIGSLPANNEVVDDGLFSCAQARGSSTQRPMASGATAKWGDGKAGQRRSSATTELGGGGASIR
ncbi:MAG: hypothetical protein DWQ35_01490 [Planctomycetota bacterium]|nr:MAG: hypothetical protein DWQ35_20970 [Planctomycetota bacterium]REJ97662.1 MAG: hypothetical protein DWQ35_01490 [Planctomycetota bacterium]REK48775.1 MAG: hypothetical protein DWQ46_01535 [Planctomycetota bacterium]